MTRPARRTRALVLAWMVGVSVLTAPAQEGAGPAAERPRYGEPPAARSGPLAPGLEADLAVLVASDAAGGRWDEAQHAALARVGSSGDVRLGWLVSDLMRVTGGYEQRAALSDAATELLGLEGLDPGNPWKVTTNHLIAWDVPAPPGYLERKRAIYTRIVPEWSRLFAEGDVDWRHVTWGGVGIDARPPDATDRPCNCIPAADDPAVTDAAGAAWLDDDAVVFGIVVAGEARAYPRRVMEVREMVNDTLGGRRLGIPYCTLCGSAQAWFTDRVPAGVEPLVLRTSGLLVRSNKVMFDLDTWSVFDTFRGRALTGPLAERGVTLEATSVVTTTWGAWRAAHPDTTVLAEALALGRDFDLRNTRDADGPIFPVGDVDPRLPVQADVLGVVAPSGTSVAFEVEATRAALARGEEVRFEDVRVILDAGGLRAVGAKAEDLGGHLAFWFAWSQFHPGTELYGVAHPPVLDRR